MSLHPGENAFAGGFDFDHGLIGFHFQQRFALGNAFAFLLLPGDELAGFLRHLQRGHDDADGHSRREMEAKGSRPQPRTPTPSVLALASIISTTRWLGGASFSRMVGSGPLTVW